MKAQIPAAHEAIVRAATNTLPVPNCWVITFGHGRGNTFWYARADNGRWEDEPRDERSGRDGSGR